MMEEKDPIRTEILEAISIHLIYGNAIRYN